MLQPDLQSPVLEGLTVLSLGGFISFSSGEAFAMKFPSRPMAPPMSGVFFIVPFLGSPPFFL